MEGKELLKPEQLEAHGVEVARVGRPPLSELVQRVSVPIVTSGAVVMSLVAGGMLLLEAGAGGEALSAALLVWGLGFMAWVFTLWPFAMTAVMARYRGRSMAGWLLASLLLNPWLTLGLLAILPDLGDREEGHTRALPGTSTGTLPVRRL